MGRGGHGWPSDLVWADRLLTLHMQLENHSEAFEC
jgi:hypothetical protein